jgi:hypothetical protein
MHVTDKKRKSSAPQESPAPSALKRERQERLDTLSSRIGDGYANVPEDEGIAEIDAAVAKLRRR